MIQFCSFTCERKNDFFFLRILESKFITLFSSSFFAPYEFPYWNNKIIIILNIISSIAIKIALKRKIHFNYPRNPSRLSVSPFLSTEEKKSNRSGHFSNLSNFRPSMDHEPSDVPQVGEHNTRGGARRKIAGVRRNDTLRNPVCIRNAMNKHYYDRILRSAGLTSP